MVRAARISPESILAAAEALLEAEGLEGLGMRALARQLGVQAPSLYFHFESREDLIQQLILEALDDLAGRMEAAEAAGGDFSQRAMGLARAYVAFAQAAPQRFALLFGPCPAEQMLDLPYSDRATAPLLRLAADIAGAADAIAFAQAVWALVHGYAVLESAGQFRLTSDSSPALELGLRALIAGAGAGARLLT